MNLSDIGVRIDSLPADAAAQDMARAILTEIDALLARLVASGESAAIDLRSMPLKPGDLAALRKLLGSGEVHALVQVAGPSEVQETRYPGVWWVTHMASTCSGSARPVTDACPGSHMPTDAKVRLSST